MQKYDYFVISTSKNNRQKTLLNEKILVTLQPISQSGSKKQITSRLTD
jgi:hypothetical protein